MNTDTTDSVYWLLEPVLEPCSWQATLGGLYVRNRITVGQRWYNVRTVIYMEFRIESYIGCMRELLYGVR